MGALGAHMGPGGRLCGFLTLFGPQSVLWWGRTVSIAEIASGGAKVGLWLRTRGLVVGTVGEWILLGCRHSKSAAEVICGALTRREEGS